MSAIDSATLQAVCGGRWLQEGPAITALHLAYDTRRISDGPRSVFFALRTASRNGAEFVSDAWRAGVRLFVVHPDFVGANRWQGGSFLAVGDTLLAMQQVAAWHRSHIGAQPVLAITGSNGKTVVKDWLYELLSPELNVHRSPRSYNSQLGVAISVWRIPADADLSIIEAGVSQAGEMARLQSVIRPSHGLFSHLGDAHDGGFRNRTHKLEEKFGLFEGVVQLTVRVDDVRVAAVAVNWQQRHPDAELRAWRLVEPNPPPSSSTDDFPSIPLFCRVSAQPAVNPGSRWRLEWHHGGVDYLDLPFHDAASVENALNCRIYLEGMGLPEGVLAARFGQLRPPRMRMEIREALHGGLLINDAYSLDLDSLGIALQYLQSLPGPDRRIAILSEFDDSHCRHNPDIYPQALQLLRTAGVELLLAVGERWHKVGNPTSLPECLFYRDTEHLLEAMPYDRLSRCAILLKGARRFALERVDRRLSLKQHQTVFEVDLEAVLYNFRAFRAHLHAATRVMVMVKALSYGSGKAEVAALVQHHKADYLAVAYPDEGVTLRQNGIHLPIMVMNPDPDSLALLAEHGLEPEVFGFSMLEAVVEHALSSPSSLPLRIHLNLDTGMNRLGFSQSDWPGLCHRLSLLVHDRLRVQSVYTHLVASESAEHDAFTRQQLTRFEDGCRLVCSALGYMPLRHALNTAGIVRFPGAQLDMVRLGIGLYGVDPVAEYGGTGIDGRGETGVDGRGETGVDGRGETGIADVSDRPTSAVCAPRNHSTDRDSSRELDIPPLELHPVGSLLTTIAQIHETRPGDTIGYGRRGRPDGEARVATIPIGYADGIPWHAGEGRAHFWLNGRLVPTLGRICMDLCMLDVTGIDCREGDVVEIFGRHRSVSALAMELDTIPYALLSGISHRVKRVYLRES